MFSVFGRDGKKEDGTSVNPRHVDAVLKGDVLRRALWPHDAPRGSAPRGRGFARAGMVRVGLVSLVDVSNISTQQGVARGGGTSGCDSVGGSGDRMNNDHQCTCDCSPRGACGDA